MVRLFSPLLLKRKILHFPHECLVSIEVTWSAEAINSSVCVILSSLAANYVVPAFSDVTGCQEGLQAVSA